MSHQPLSDSLCPDLQKKSPIRSLFSDLLDPFALACGVGWVLLLAGALVFLTYRGCAQPAAASEPSAQYRVACYSGGVMIFVTDSASQPDCDGDQVRFNEQLLGRAVRVCGQCVITDSVSGRPVFPEDIMPQSPAGGS